MRALSRFSSLRDAIDTRAPSSANAFAQANPIPLLPPVMRTTFPSKPSFIFFLQGQREFNTNTGRPGLLLARFFVLFLLTRPKRFDMLLPHEEKNSMKNNLMKNILWSLVLVV